MRRVLVCLMSVGLLGGCGTLIKDRSQVPQSPVGGFGTTMGSPHTKSPRGSPDPTWQNADVVTLDLPDLIARYSGKAGTRSLEAALADFDALPLASRPERRNAIVGAVLMASDKNCDVYLEYFHGNQIAIKAFSSVSATLFSGAAAIASPASSSRVLAALGSAATGVGGNLNEAAFSSKAADVVASGIRAERATMRLEMDTRMAKPDNYTVWPLSLALADAFRYHGRCNAISGLAYLQGKAEKAKSDAEAGRSPGG
ncbi:hypothetical protein [Phenylobacterium sp.]|uniref:hypothetical protein n=1 Tax=Phenylobacterium sp. TaxID=1871053 RepID=UPI0027272D62|nr:hypothetical protein [Phenylobacterium sp.]MDO8379536.1 hypothetical protein [Phenylobacterium sp.]